MCGIVGYVGNPSYPIDCLDAMIRAINHRGPDDQGIWFDETLGVGLGFARLSILDLSLAGHQPMSSFSKNLVMIFNGEIYNHKSIRAELDSIQSRRWLGHSDSETLLAAIEQWGLEDALKKAKGMFAIALLDKNKKSLSLACDRMGEKPVYYGWVNSQFIFASELSAIQKFPKFNNPIDRDSLALFLRFNSIPSPNSIYRDIYKLEPGTIFQLNLNSMENKVHNFWSLEELLTKNKHNSFRGSAQDSVNQLEKVLSNAVVSQMESDVPLGAFLSGGIDSSSIVAIMQSNSISKINTFSIGFHSDAYNEAHHARKIAEFLGTNHNELYITENDALEVIPDLPTIYSEPFGDSSQIPTYLVSKFAKGNITVALSGDGGDELFGGYNRYLFAEKAFKKFLKTPSLVRKLISATALSISEERLDFILGGMLDKRFANIGYKLHKAANVLASNSIRDLHFKLLSQVQNPLDWIINDNNYEIQTKLNDGIERFQGLNSIEQMMAYDLITYLPTDILTKIDRAAMAVSLETRLPFLDRNVIEFSASLPMKYKIHKGTTKWILREMLYKYVPENLINRPKMGFAVPLSEWLRGPLRDWAESLLDKDHLHDGGFFNVEFVRNKWLDHLNNKRNFDHQLWNILMFQAWLEKN